MVNEFLKKFVCFCKKKRIVSSSGKGSKPVDTHRDTRQGMTGMTVLGEKFLLVHREPQNVFPS